MEGTSKKTKPNWLKLPRNITSNILKRLNTFEIVTSACLVCPLWWYICKDPLMWRSIHMNNFNYNLHYNPIRLNKIWCYAIKRSCGYLEEIDVTYFGTDDLLQFIANNGRNLRFMRLLGCMQVSDKGFRKVVIKFPNLEEVNISMCKLSKDSLEALGRSCPRLKSLTFTGLSFSYVAENDDEALVISQTMPGLCNLNISRNGLTNVGLLAILDGCPLLESLDIRGCYNLILTDTLKKRCFGQIKYLKLPEKIIYDDIDEVYDYLDFISYDY